MSNVTLINSWYDAENRWILQKQQYLVCHLPKINDFESKWSQIMNIYTKILHILKSHKEGVPYL